MIAVLWIGLIAIGIIGAWQNRTLMIDDRKEQLKTLVNEAYVITAHYAALADNKTLTQKKAKKQALQVIGAIRYGTDGYLSTIRIRPW